MTLDLTESFSLLVARSPIANDEIFDLTYYQIVVSCAGNVGDDGRRIFQIILGTFRDGETKISWSENELQNRLCTLEIKIPEGR